MKMKTLIKNNLEQECLFCKIIRHEVPSDIVYENEMVLAFLDINPNSNGHTLIIPKKHFENYSSCEDDYLVAIALAKKIVAKKMLTALGPLEIKGINYTSNQGKEAYQVVMHYHEHVIPKYLKNEGYVITNKTNHATLKPNTEIIDLLKIN